MQKHPDNTIGVYYCNSVFSINEADKDGADVCGTPSIAPSVVCLLICFNLCYRAEMLRVTTDL